MAFKQIASLLALTAVLAGCAAGPGTAGVQPQNLRKPAYLITEVVVGGMDFPMLQSNLFQHRAACGSAPRFVMHERETSYASLIETAELPASYENVVMLDLTQYPESMRSPMRIVVHAYSYYQNVEVRRRVERMLAAVRTPGVCE